MERKIRLTQASLDNHFDGEEDRQNDAFDEFAAWCEDEDLTVKVNPETNEVTFRRSDDVKAVLVAATEIGEEGMSDDFEVIISLLSEKLLDEDNYDEESEDEESEDDEEFNEDDLASSSAVKWSHG